MDGYTCFMSGFGEGVDQYFAEIVLEKQKDNPALELIAVIPYRKRLERLKEKGRTYKMLETCLEVIVIEEKYHPSVYSKQSRYMTERSGRVIAVYDGRKRGGTVRIIRFAHMLKRELREIPTGEINLPSKSWKYLYGHGPGFKAQHHKLKKKSKGICQQVPFFMLKYGQGCIGINLIKKDFKRFPNHYRIRH
jgi:hypothetical protein